MTENNWYFMIIRSLRIKDKNVSQRNRGFPGSWVVEHLLSMQETWAPSLIWEDAGEQLTAHATATESVLQSPGTASAEPTGANTEASAPCTWDPQEKPTQQGTHTPQGESGPAPCKKRKAQAATKTLHDRKQINLYIKKKQMRETNGQYIYTQSHNTKLPYFKLSYTINN